MSTRTSPDTDGIFGTHTVHERVDDFLLAVGFDRRFVTARKLISDEVARVLR
jgi:hypothetical protein